MFSQVPPPTSASLVTTPGLMRSGSQVLTRVLGITERHLDRGFDGAMTLNDHREIPRLSPNGARRDAWKQIHKRGIKVATLGCG